MEIDVDREQRLETLFGEYLAAVDRGEDRDAELLAQAGELAAELSARMRLERELRALSPGKGTASGPDASPQRLGRFRILGLLGKGGISVVYLAHDPDMGRRVALKVLNSESLLDKQNRAWMLNEARALAQLEHPNVVKVHEVGETGTHTYLAMELVTGPSLRAVIDELARRARGEPPGPKADVADLAERLRPYSARVAVLRQLADALAVCHDSGILHRDIKPHNVLFDARGTPKLIDFGLAHDARADEDSRIGLTQNLVGTAAYLAPEQVSDNETGAEPRSDQFSFGIVAYELFALLNPFLKKTQRKTMAAIEEAEPPSLRSLAPAIASDLALVIHHALEREPEARYPALGALAADLDAIHANRPISISAPSLAHLGRLWARRHRRGLAVGAATAGFALLAGATLWGTVVLRSRNQVVADLRQIRPGEFQSAPDFERTFEPLLDLQRRSIEFDSQSLRRLFGALTPEVRSTVEAWSSSLSSRHRADVALSQAQGIPLQEGIYRHLFWQESILCPDCPDNRANRRRGRVGLPLGLARDQEVALDVLCRLEAIPDPDVAHAFRPTDLAELLVPGTYRLQVWEPAARHLTMESVFFVPEGWLPARTIEIHAPRSDLFAGAIQVQRGKREYPQGALIVPAFRILDHLVTVAEFEVFLTETGFKASEFTGTGSRAAPASVTYDSALAYAIWAGGHIVTSAELFHALESNALPSPKATPLAAGEYLLDPLPTDALTPSWFPYQDLTRHEFKIVVRSGPTFSKLTRDGAENIPVGFRIAFAADEPAVYRRLANSPLEK